MTDDHTAHTRDSLTDLLASLRADGVEPDHELLRRAEELGVDETELTRRADSMARVRSALGALAAAGTTLPAPGADRAAARRAIDAAGAEPGRVDPRRLHRGGAHRHRILTTAAAVVAVAVVASVVITASVAILGGPGSDVVDQLASEGAESFGPDTDEVGGEPAPTAPPFPLDAPVIGAAATPADAIDLARRHWTGATPAPGPEERAALDAEALSPGADAPVSGDTADPPVCDVTPEPTDRAVVLIDELAHLVVRFDDHSVRVIRLVDCREVGSA